MGLKEIYETAVNRLKKPDMGELSHSTNDIWGMRSLGAYNPDDLVGKKGLGIYKKMQLRDGQVKAVFMLKKHARLSTPWEVRAQDEDDPEAVKQKEFIEECFKEMNGSMNSFLLKIWNVMRDGYAVAELNYKVLDTGEYKGKIGIDNIKVRNAEDFSFICDEYGNIQENGLVEGGENNLPVNKFIIVSYNPSDDNSESIYGESDFRAAYRYYFSNDVIQRFWNIYLEKFGQPTIVGRYPNGTKKEKQDTYLDILKNIQADTAVVLPEGLTAEYLEASRKGDAGYKNAFDTNNAMIARSLLVGSLLMDTGDKGSYALSKTHFDIFIYVLNYLGQETEDTIINEQIIKRIIDFNFVNPKYPVFKFESLVKDDQEGKAKVAKLLVDAGLIDPNEEWVREFLKIPAKDKDVVLPEPKPASGGDLGFSQNNFELSDAQRRECDKETELINKNKLKPLAEKVHEFKAAKWTHPNGHPRCLICGWEEPVGGVCKMPMSWYGKHKFDDEEAWEKERDILRKKGILKKEKYRDTSNFAEGLSRQPNKYEKKCDFTRIVNNLNKYETQATDELIVIIQKQKDMLKKSILKSKVIETNNAKEVEKLQLSYVGEFRDTIKRWLQELWRYGETEVQSELKQYKFVGLPAEKAMEYLRNKAFSIAGVERDDILKKAKTLLYSGMKNGSSADEIMFELDNMFKEYIGKPGIETREGKLLTPNHLENIVRTNFSDAYNQGRLDMAEDKDFKGFVTGMMFSAIMDERTTEVCEALDGQIFEIGDPDLARVTPPLHYMCFPGETKVTIYKNNGNSRAKKRIDNIKIGDIVLTQNDEKHKVTHKFEREYKDELIVIEMDDGNILKATPNHPIFTENRGWVKAEDLTMEDNLQSIPSRACFKKFKHLKEKDTLKDLYINQRKTLKQIAKIYNVGASTINYWMKKFGIELRHGSEAIKTQWENNDERKRQIAKILLDARNKPDYVYYWKGKKRPDISKRLKKYNHLIEPEVIEKAKKTRIGMMKGKNNPMYGKQSPHGKGMWYKTPYDKTVFMRSKWEVRVADYLTSKKLKWEYEPERYNLGNRTYLPDFKIFTKDSFYLIEVKGWFHKRHQETMRLFREIYPNINIILWNKKCMKLAGIL